MFVENYIMGYYSIVVWTCPSVLTLKKKLGIKLHQKKNSEKNKKYIM